jgi:hypothetical protein
MPFIPFTVINGTDFDLTGQWVTFGMPFGRDDQLYDPSILAVRDSGGTLVPSSYDILSRWDGLPNDPSKPIKWLQVNHKVTQVDGSGHYASVSGGLSQYKLELGIPPVQGGCSVTATNEQFTINNSTGIFKIRRKSFTLFDHVSIGTNTPINDSGNFVLIDDGGQSLFPSNVVTTLEENNSCRVVVLQTGQLYPSGVHLGLPSTTPVVDEVFRYTARWYFNSNSTDVKLDFTVENPRLFFKDGDVGTISQKARFINNLYLEQRINTNNILTGITSRGIGCEIDTNNHYFLLQSGDHPQRSNDRFGTVTSVNIGGNPTTVIKQTTSHRIHYSEKYSGSLTEYGAKSLHDGGLSIRGSQGGFQICVDRFWEKFNNSYEVTGQLFRCGLFPTGQTNQIYVGMKYRAINQQPYYISGPPAGAIIGEWAADNYPVSPAPAGGSPHPSIVVRPQSVSNYRIDGGTWLTKTLNFKFFMAQDEPNWRQVKEFANLSRYPLTAVANGDRYRTTKALGFFFLEDIGTPLDVVEDRSRKFWEMLADDFAADPRNEHYYSARHYFDSASLPNMGIQPMSYGWDQYINPGWGEGTTTHHYDTSKWFFVGFLRNRDYRIYDLARALAIFSRDRCRIKTHGGPNQGFRQEPFHASSPYGGIASYAGLSPYEKGTWIGESFSPAPSHTWVEGVNLLYALTADRLSKRAAIHTLMAFTRDWFRPSLWAYWGAVRIREPGWAILALTSGYNFYGPLQSEQIAGRSIIDEARIGIDTVRSVEQSSTHNATWGGQANMGYVMESQGEGITGRAVKPWMNAFYLTAACCYTLVTNDMQFMTHMGRFSAFLRRSGQGQSGGGLIPNPSPGSRPYTAYYTWHPTIGGQNLIPFNLSSLGLSHGPAIACFAILSRGTAFENSLDIQFVKDLSDGAVMYPQWYLGYGNIAGYPNALVPGISDANWYMSNAGNNIPKVMCELYLPGIMMCMAARFDYTNVPAPPLPFAPLPSSAFIPAGDDNNLNYISAISQNAVVVRSALPTAFNGTETINANLEENETTVASSSTQSAPAGGGTVNFPSINSSSLSDGNIIVSVTIAKPGHQTMVFTGVTAIKDTVLPDTPTSGSIEGGTANSGGQITAKSMSNVTVGFTLGASHQTFEKLIFTVVDTGIPPLIVTGTSDATESGFSGAETVLFTGINASSLLDGVVYPVLELTDLAPNLRLYTGQGGQKVTSTVVSLTGYIGSYVLEDTGNVRNIVSTFNESNTTVRVVFNNDANPANTLTVILTDSSNNNITSASQSSPGSAGNLDFTSLDVSTLDDGPLALTVDFNAAETIFQGATAFKDTVGPASATTGYVAPSGSNPTGYINTGTVHNVYVNIELPSSYKGVESTYVTLTDGNGGRATSTTGVAPTGGGSMVFKGIYGFLRGSVSDSLSSGLTLNVFTYDAYNNQTITSFNNVTRDLIPPAAITGGNVRTGQISGINIINTGSIDASYIFIGWPTSGLSTTDRLDITMTDEHHGAYTTGNIIPPVGGGGQVLGPVIITGLTQGSIGILMETYDLANNRSDKPVENARLYKDIPIAPKRLVVERTHFNSENTINSTTQGAVTVSVHTADVSTIYPEPYEYLTTYTRLVDETGGTAISGVRLLTGEVRENFTVNASSLQKGVIQVEAIMETPGYNGATFRGTPAFKTVFTPPIPGPGPIPGHLISTVTGLSSPIIIRLE